MTHITGDLYDVWNPGVKSGLSSYISGSVASYKNDKNLLGWSFGNETDGIVWDKDIVAILQMSNVKTSGVHSVPAKHELVNYMRTVTLKSLSIVQIADRWGVALSDAAKNSAAHGDPMPAQAEIEKTVFGDKRAVRRHHFDAPLFRAHLLRFRAESVQGPPIPIIFILGFGFWWERGRKRKTGT